MTAANFGDQFESAQGIPPIMARGTSLISKTGVPLLKLHNVSRRRSQEEMMPAHFKIVTQCDL